MTENKNATTVDGQPVSHLRTWLETQASQNGLPYLLAHADDGVIWGLYTQGKLTLSGEVFAEMNVELRPKTLQQARIFGSQGEVLLWRVEDGFRSSSILDGVNKPENAIEERHYLWGAGQVINREKRFTLMEDGRQGLLHAVPHEIGAHRYAALQVRHYVAYDEQDQAYISHSRLVDLIEIPGGTA